MAASVLLAPSQISMADADPGVSGHSSTDWPMAGYNIDNIRSNPLETTISSRNAGNLAVKWTYTTHGDVSATPTVSDGTVYFPDWGGYLDKVDAQSGKLIWAHKISDYDGIAGAQSRTSPAIANGILYIGDHNGAHLIAVNARTGDLVWIRQLDSHPDAVITQSPSVYGGVVYEGISSGEQNVAADPTYACCTFRGSLTATNARTGAPMWKRYTLPDNGGVVGGYSGGSVWGGTPAIDPLHNLVFVGTGNNYQVPRSVDDCHSGGGTAQQCLSPSDHIDSVLALDLRTGAIKWSYGPATFDAWNFGCMQVTTPTNCPKFPGDDLDFSDGAHLFTITGPHGTTREVVGAGSKSGQFVLLDALTGAVIWSATPGPGSNSGGILWGSSVDGKRIYVAEADFGKKPYMLPDGTTTTSSSWAALDPATGKVLWQTVNPSGGYAWGAVSSANGVVYASSTTGHMYALDGATGRILFDHQGPFSTNAGASVVSGTVYWGNGYAESFPGAGLTGSTTTGTFYAFSLPGR